MLIVSDFHDYYDSALGFGGIDKTIVYSRKSEESLHREPLYWRKDWQHDLSGKQLITDNRSKVALTVPMPHESQISGRDDQGKFTRIARPFLVGFCGELFPGARVILTRPGLDIYESSCLYSLAELIDLGFGTKRSSWYAPERANSFDNLFAERPRNDSLFQDLDVPIFVVWGPGNRGQQVVLITNPPLKDLGFYKIKDPFQAHQEIMMFISGVLGNKEKDTVGISDPDLAASKGYDKLSFRKEPTKKNKKRRK